MFRKILSVIFAIFMFLPNAHSAEMVNVEYIHKYLNARWGIDLPRNPLTNPYAAAAAQSINQPICGGEYEIPVDGGGHCERILER